MVAIIRRIFGRLFQSSSAVEKETGWSAINTQSKEKSFDFITGDTLLGDSAEYDVNLMESARAQWQLGEWDSLTKLDVIALKHHPDRAKLALLAAAGRLQTGHKTEDAKAYIRLAQDWGVSKKLINKILIAGVHSSLGKAASAAGFEQRAMIHHELVRFIGGRGHSPLPLNQKSFINTDEEYYSRTDLSDESSGKVDCVEIHSATVDSGLTEVPPPIREEDYTKEFYDHQIPGSIRSARIVLDELFRYYRPRSIVDIGCGAGTWIKVAMELGVEEVMGIDGKHALASLLIPEYHFKAQDISSGIVVSKRFDLLITMEVAEHLDKSRAKGFIRDLCDISDVIMFSAAIPLQGGTCHRNEAWPEFWASLFAMHGFKPLDFLRDNLWGNEQVEWWYRQNILIFVTDRAKDAFFKAIPYADPYCLARVHPDFVKLITNETLRNLS